MVDPHSGWRFCTSQYNSEQIVKNRPTLNSHYFDAGQLGAATHNHSKAKEK
jgi:hypothetical protein